MLIIYEKAKLVSDTGLTQLALVLLGGLWTPWLSHVSLLDINNLQNTDIRLGYSVNGMV